MDRESELRYIREHRSGIVLADYALDGLQADA